MVPFILAFSLLSLCDNFNYYGYEYQAKVTKLASPFLSALNNLDDLFHKSQFKNINKTYSSSSAFSSSIMISDISESYSFFQAPTCSVNFIMINNSYCHQTKCGRNSFISIFDFHYQIRYINSLRYFGDATAILNTDSLNITQCFSPIPTMEFHFTGKSIIQNLTGASIRSNVPIEIASIFDSISPQITEIVQQYLNTTINLNTIAFMSNFSFKIDDQELIVSNNINSINSYHQENIGDYIFFNYNSTIFFKGSQINETINDVSINSGLINATDSSQVCASMHLAISAMNLISTKGKYNFQLNTTKMGIGKFSVEYFDIIPEFSFNLNGDEIINIYCSKNPNEKIMYITPSSMQFNYTLNIPLICLFMINGNSNPFLESNVSVMTQTQIKVDSLQDEGFNLQFYNPNLNSFTTHSKLSPQGKMQLKSILTQGSIDIIQDYDNGTSKWDPFVIPFPFIPNLHPTQFTIEGNETCLYFN